jgi:two-component system chemotaxis response regulator CheY
MLLCLLATTLALAVSFDCFCDSKANMPTPSNKWLWPFCNISNSPIWRTAVMHTGQRILVVDDLEMATDNIIRILKDANYTDIDCLHNAASALSALRQKEYNLVITDAQMEPITGSELTRLVRADGLSKVKIILIGLFGGDDKALLDGADAYITKPFEPRDLKEKVADVLSTVAQLASGWRTWDMLLMRIGLLRSLVQPSLSSSSFNTLSVLFRKYAGSIPAVSVQLSVWGISSAENR